MLDAGAKFFGLRSMPVDVLLHQRMNLLTNMGLMSLFAIVRRLRPHATAWFAVPCGSWIFMSRGSTHRSYWRAGGNTSYEKVADANRLCRRVCYLLTYLAKKKVNWVLENPSTSLLFRYKPLRKLLRKFKCINVNVCLGCFGADTQKLVTLVGNAPWLRRLSRQLTSARRKQLKRVRTFLKLQTTRNYTCNRTGRAKCAGGKDLKATQVYPGTLGLLVGKLVRDHLRTASNEQEPITDQGLSFFDSGSESDDSGLGDLIGNIDL